MSDSIRSADVDLEGNLKVTAGATLVRDSDAAYEVAEGRYQDAIEEVHNRRAVLAQRRSEVDLARQQLADTVLASPIDGAVAQRLEGVQVAPGPAAEIQQVKGRWPWYVLQQRRDVLADVVVARAFPVALGVQLVVRQGACGDVLQVFGTQRHATSFHAAPS